jgi:D-alanyl-lipoteichoic acid acyltransferase DltB (MBOAT superfamily)
LDICLAWLTTRLCINASWVLFRAKSLQQTIQVYRGLLELNEFSGERWAWISVSYSHAMFNQVLIAALLIVLIAKPTQTWSEQYLSGAQPLTGQ